MSEEQKIVEITEEVKEAAEETAEKAAEAAEETAAEAAETVEEKAEEAAEAAEETVAEAVETVEEKAEEAVEAAEETAAEAVETVEEKAEEAVEAAKETAAEAAEEVTATAEEFANSTEEAAGEATKAVNEAAEETAENADEAAKKIAEAAAQVKEAAGDILGQVGSFAAAAGGKLAEAAADVAENVKEAITETVGKIAEALGQKEETKETMDDFKDELEASYKKLRRGDIVTGTVIDVSETDVTIDFNYYAPGRIPAEEMSNDPAFNLAEDVHVGDTLTASVLKTDDGAGNMLLSCRQAANELAWEKLKAAMDEKKAYHGKISGVVKGGAVMFVEGVRGFIPASKLALGYVEDTNSFLNKEIDVQVIEVNRADRKVVLSARDLLRRKAMEEKNRKMQKFAVGTVLEGKVESLKDYGAFVDLGDGVSGLLHVSQISDKRIAKPSQVLKVGDTVKVRITKVADNKISLSMREASENTAREADDDTPREYSDGGSISTGLGALLKNLKIGK